MSLDLDRSTTEDASMSPHCVEIHRGDVVCHSAASTATMTRSKNCKRTLSLDLCCSGWVHYCLSREIFIGNPAIPDSDADVQDTGSYAGP